jgi:hypothetical protein
MQSALYGHVHSTCPAKAIYSLLHPLQFGVINGVKYLYPRPEERGFTALWITGSLAFPQEIPHGIENTCERDP